MHFFVYIKKNKNTKTYNPGQNLVTLSKFSTLPIHNVDNRVIFLPLFWNKRDIFRHWLGGMGIYDLVQVSQLLVFWMEL